MRLINQSEAIEFAKDHRTLLIVAVSGGKDSLICFHTMQKFAAEHSINLKAVYCFTGNESEITENYLKELSASMGYIERLVPDIDKIIKRKITAIKKGSRRHSEWSKDKQRKAIKVLETAIKHGTPFIKLCLAKGRFPSKDTRFCSQHLKTIPIQNFISKSFSEYERVIMVSGIRAAESNQRAKLDSFTVTGETLADWYPIFDWDTEKVFDYIKQNDLPINPLYKKPYGFDRVGCWPCIFSKKSEIAKLFSFHGNALDKILTWEQLILPVKHDEIGTFFSPKMVGKSFQKRFFPHEELNGLPYNTIESVALWAQTKHRETSKFKSSEEITQCVSNYGMCD